MSISHSKAAFRNYVETQSVPGDQRRAAEVFFAPDAQINVVHPFNGVVGYEGYCSTFLNPLRGAFSSLRRTDYISFGGRYDGAEWVTSTGYYTGQFIAPFLTIPPTGELAHLRFGEFHRMEQGRAVESYIFLDLPELMIACGCWPISESPGQHRGYTGYLPGPARQDGLIWSESDQDRSSSSYALVTDMLRNLATADEAWRPFWHDHMLWYGPAAFGSFVGIEEFASFQIPFEGAFSEWIGGAVEGSRTRHFARFADGDFVCSGGWPSLNMLQVKPFLGQQPSEKRLYMRVCDWWRREGDLLAENWVFVDIPHVLLQLGTDLFPDHHPGAKVVLSDLPE